LPPDVPASTHPRDCGLKYLIGERRKGLLHWWIAPWLEDIRVARGGVGGAVSRLWEEPMSYFIKLTATAVASVFAATGAFAEGYPEQSITMIVPFAAGGPTDTVGRLVAEKMSADLGQQIVVENIGGAGGTLGAGQVAAAAADGYTILLYNMSMATAVTLYRDLAFDPLTDFGYVGLVTEVPMTLVARKDLEPGDMAAFIPFAKQNADKMTIANAGIGGASHMCGMLLMQALDVPIVSVPYKGTGPAMTDLLGGQVDLLCDQTTNTTEQIKAGTVKAYGVTTPERLSILPDLPTMGEAGLKDMEITVWHGVWTPKDTPAEVNERLAKALQAALADPDLIAKLAALGTAPSPAEDATPAALKATMEADAARWKPIIEAAGVYAD
jgi:tripartite-type tricarboxylate transporter receptor subunit TctC